MREYRYLRLIVALVDLFSPVGNHKSDPSDSEVAFTSRLARLLFCRFGVLGALQSRLHIGGGGGRAVRRGGGGGGTAARQQRQHVTDLPTISVLTRRARECLDELFEAVVVSALTRRARERLDELFEAFVVAIARALACKLSATADTADVLFRSLVLEWTCTLSREVRVNFCAQREWTAAYDALIAPDAADGATTTAPTSSAAGDEPLAARRGTWEAQYGARAARRGTTSRYRGSRATSRRTTRSASAARAATAPAWALAKDDLAADACKGGDDDDRRRCVGGDGDRGIARVRSSCVFLS